MRGRNCSAALFFLALAIQAVFALRAMAFEKTGRLADIEYRFICTDVAQLKEKINVLVILSRAAGEGGGKKAVRVALGIPTGIFRSPGGQELLEASFELGPGDTERFAFRSLLALENAEPGRYPFELRCSAGEGPPEVSPFEVAVVRGPVPPRGILSILYPALVSLLFLPFFIFFLLRLGEPGGWRTVKDAELAEPEEAWWEQEESP